MALVHFLSIKAINLKISFINKLLISIYNFFQQFIPIFGIW